MLFFFSSRRRHTRLQGDWSSDVCSSDLASAQPMQVPPILVTLSALDTNASPNGWIDDGVNETRGNNVDAHLDRNADDSPDLPRPQGSPFRVDRKSTRLNSSHLVISYAVFCL